MDVMVARRDTHVKKTWMAAPTQRTPKTINSFHLMFAKPGGTKRPSAKLNNQLPTAAMPYDKIAVSLDTA